VGGGAGGAALGDDALLVGGLALVAADAAAAAGPAGLAEVVARAVGGQVGAADGQHVGRHGRVAGRRPAVARGGDAGDPVVGGGRGLHRVVAVLAGELVAAVTHRHH